MSAPALQIGVSADDYQQLKPARVPPWLATLAIAATFCAGLYCSFIEQSLPDFAAWAASACLLLALLSSLLITPRVFAVGFLLSLAPFLLAWRIAAINGAQVLMCTAGMAVIVIALQLADCIVTDCRRHRQLPTGWLVTLLWQATVVRLCFGLNELCHSAEKIFAGLDSFHTLEKAFQGLGFNQYAAVFVVLGGLTELASAISVGLGLFARLGAAVSLVYFLVATVGFGGEWTRGYAWGTAGGGGWEYVMLLLVVFGGVMMTGAGKFSLDGWLLQRTRLPGWMVGLCTRAPYPKAFDVRQKGGVQA